MNTNSIFWDFQPDLSSGNSSQANRLLDKLLRSSLIRCMDWDKLPSTIQEELNRVTDQSQLLTQLVQQNLLTQYQADRISARKTFGLVLGNYRVLDRLGAGGMGVVFKAEHIHLPRLVAIKVLPLAAEGDSELLRRFENEMHAIAQLRHPNIVSALDAGKVTGSQPTARTLHYFVMEYVPGKDLEAFVQTNGPLKTPEACGLIYQVASALEEAHRHHLVHRDIKPSNIMVTPEGQAKLLDFGLARRFGNRLTQPGVVLGTVDYMAPEQIQDTNAVDIRADIYGLGGTLFWCLTGRIPFAQQALVVQDLAQRLNQPPPLVRSLRPEVPSQLEAVLARMLAPHPDDRYPTPQALMHALLFFVNPPAGDSGLFATGRTPPELRSALADRVDRLPSPHRILIVDDEKDIRTFCRLLVEADGIECDEAANGVLAMEAARSKRYDLILLDVDLQGMKGTEVLRQLRENPPCPHLKILMVSGYATADEMAEMMLAGADDYVTKPMSFVPLRARVKAALRLKDAQDRADCLNREILLANHDLEQNLHARDCDLVHARNALVLALAELVGYRDTETGSHLLRLQRFCRCLAAEAAGSLSFAGQIDENFIQLLEACAPLHDIGKVGLPDHLLQKPGKLNAEEYILMQTHTTIGAAVLDKVAKRYGFARVFLQMAADIARHHHERYDGQGYPDRLAGDDIPLAARLVAIADVYDALRSRRPYKPALSHDAAMRVMLENSAGHFDPALLSVFQRSSHLFAQFFGELGE
jgi:response regulator RpfG family c-di-GMP phosphodiesterase/serine/threonine protein kinase